MPAREIRERGGAEIRNTRYLIYRLAGPLILEGDSDRQSGTTLENRTKCLNVSAIVTTCGCFGFVRMDGGFSLGLVLYLPCINVAFVAWGLPAIDRPQGRSGTG